MLPIDVVAILALLSFVLGLLSGISLGRPRYY